MAWNHVIINVTYEDNSPAENIKIYYYVEYSNQVSNPSNYHMALTDENGIAKLVPDNGEENKTYLILYAYDEESFLENRENIVQISDGQTYYLMLDSDDPGLTYMASFMVSDLLFYTLTNNYDLTNFPITYSIYRKNSNNTYTLLETSTLTQQINLYRRFEASTIKILAETDDFYGFPKEWICTYAVTNNVGGSVLYRSLKKSYSFSLPSINDTIDWVERKLYLKNTISDFCVYNNNEELIFSAETNNNILTFSGTSGTMLSCYSFFSNLSNNILKIHKNHYNNYDCNCRVSASSEYDYFIVESGKTRNDAIILERESNVCMTNKDLYDYIISLTSMEIDINNFERFEEYNDIRVGVSKISYFNAWISAVTNSLPQGLQGLTASTLQEFKNIFVNNIRTNNVITYYTLDEQYIEPTYMPTLPYHGYVWDRCFIPFSGDSSENCLKFSLDQQGVVGYCVLNFCYEDEEPVNYEPYDFEISVDDGLSWDDYNFNSQGYGDTIELSRNYGITNVKFRRKNTNTGNTLSDDKRYYYFAIDGRCNSEGSVTSLLDGRGINDIFIGVNCFRYLFKNCNQLLTPPQLNSTLISNYCYEGMFYGCSSLQVAPELLAENVYDGSYKSMFYGCSSLQTAPELISLTAKNSCYMSMFEGCTSLISAPLLPATIVYASAYASMFKDCTGLTAVQSSLTATIDTNASLCYQSMFYNCISLKTPPLLPSTYVKYGCYEYMFKGCSSLLSTPQLPSNTLDTYCYLAMFEDCTSLQTAPNLNAGTLAKGCYERMFKGCTSLTGISQLTAQTLADSCYRQMYNECTSLTAASISLNATTLASHCYELMFKGCTNLRTAPSLNMTGTTPSLKYYCFREMFSDCSKLRSLPSTKSSLLSIGMYQQLAEGCFYAMFNGCSSLTVPNTFQLIAMTAKEKCYTAMFKGCASLTLTSAFTIELNNSLSATTNACNQMFANCTSLVSGATPKSSILGPSACTYMYSNCTNLKCIKCNFSATTEGVWQSTNSNDTLGWVQNVSSAGTFIYPNTTWNTNYAFFGSNGIPNGWARQAP